MDNYLQGIPLNMFLIALAIGLFFLAVFALYRKFIIPSQMLLDSGLKRKNVFIRVEIIFWALYCGLLIYLALKFSLLISSILLGLLVLTFLDFWRNFFVGITLKFSAHFHPGDAITLNDLSGRIVNFGYRSLRMINKQGEEVLIPYRLINSVVKIEQQSTPKVVSKTLEIDLSGMENVTTKERLKEAVYANPWIIVNKPITITISDNSAHINFYVLNSELFEKAKKALLKTLKM